MQPPRLADTAERCYPQREAEVTMQKQLEEPSILMRLPSVAHGGEGNINEQYTRQRSINA